MNWMILQHCEYSGHSFPIAQFVAEDDCKNFYETLANCKGYSYTILKKKENHHAYF